MNTHGGPILDIGAGTRLTTALMTRVWDDPGLRRRVTILPFSALDASMLSVIAGAVLSASLVHFLPHERQRLWPLLVERLAPDGRIVVEVQCPAQSTCLTQ